MDNSFLGFLHSLLRYAVLLALLWAFVVNLRGWLTGRPILTGDRMVTILAMVFCHVQLVLGGILYAMHYTAIDHMEEPHRRFFKYEHIGTMIIAIALITVGRMLSKKANAEYLKQRTIVIFYGIGLLLILWAVPWPFTEVGHALGWL
ncbi:MAG: cytochrome B [Flavobacteriales bacterium]|nr:cytochrome B [Flavobacteriales bacterium]MBL0129681.1 cytochrome B [Flavobacteriales bacterium]MCC6938075.1 hypothetical protein [Flavobacteriales bacterium]